MKAKLWNILMGLIGAGMSIYSVLKLNNPEMSILLLCGSGMMFISLYES